MRHKLTTNTLKEHGAGRCGKEDGITENKENQEEEFNELGRVVVEGICGSSIRLPVDGWRRSKIGERSRSGANTPKAREGVHRS